MDQKNHKADVFLQRIGLLGAVQNDFEISNADWPANMPIIAPKDVLHEHSL
jgi:hypothetical protein